MDFQIGFALGQSIPVCYARFLLSMNPYCVIWVESRTKVFLDCAKVFQYHQGILGFPPEWE